MQAATELGIIASRPAPCRLGVAPARRAGAEDMRTSVDHVYPTDDLFSKGKPPPRCASVLRSLAGVRWKPSSPTRAPTDCGRTVPTHVYRAASPLFPVEALSKTSVAVFYNIVVCPSVFRRERRLASWCEASKCGFVVCGC